MMWYTEEPPAYHKWYLCRVDGEEVPLLWGYCPICGHGQWYMDAGKRYIVIEEPVEWAQVVDYTPRFDPYKQE